MKNITLLLINILLLISCQQKNETLFASEENNKPNILLIMVDDMGFTDIGCFGGEIETPNIDLLASQGVIFNNFHTSVSCSPTRSMLMSGTDNHIAGLGNMSELITPEQRGKRGYEGHLNNSVVSLAEVLRDGGYHTYMAGKWHLGHEQDYIPFARGFEKSFSMLQGGASHWSDMSGLQAATQPIAKYVLNNDELKELPKDFYSSRSYADFLIESIRSNKKDGKPFLAYFAPTAAHDPIHVPEPWLSKYRGLYDEGYDVLKSKRIEGAKQMGIISSGAPDPTLHPSTIPWNDLSSTEQTLRTRTMEVYAGMIDNMDYHIGRIINFLKDIEAYDNTIIIFTSDNGPNPWEAIQYPSNEGTEWFAGFDNSLDNIGKRNSFVGIGLGWAGASAGPLDFFKLTAGEGGIRTPLIISGPDIKNKSQIKSFAYVTDIMPTILEYTGIDHPETYNNQKIERMRGRSLKATIEGREEGPYTYDEFIGGEMAGDRWMQKGNYKAVAVGKSFSDGKWRLYNTSIDPGETHDLSLDQPETLKELQEAWLEYCKEVGAVILE